MIFSIHHDSSVRRDTLWTCHIGMRVTLVYPPVRTLCAQKVLGAIEHVVLVLLFAFDHVSVCDLDQKGRHSAVGREPLVHHSYDEHALHNFCEDWIQVTCMHDPRRGCYHPYLGLD